MGWVSKINNDGVEAEKRKYRASFQVSQVSSEALQRLE